MANAGFYWCGSDQPPDQVRCFVCLKEVEDWDMDDDPRYSIPHFNYIFILFPVMFTFPNLEIVS